MFTEANSRPESPSRTFNLPYRLLMLSLLLVGFANAQNNSVTTSTGAQGGVSALWIFANLSFTGMRAQASGSVAWKVIAFIFGFPGTLLTLLVVKSGSERAYGIDMPRRS